MEGIITMKRILYVHNVYTSFVQIDHDLLSKAYHVTDWHEDSPRKVNPLAVYNAVKKHDIVFCWFASWHSFLPVLFAHMLGKPAIAVVGGYDVARVPEAGYGSQRGGIRKIISQMIVRKANHLIVNSQSAQRETIQNTGVDPHKVSLCYHGLPEIPMGPLMDRDNIVLTVGKVWRENLLRKGLLPFVQTAAYFPDQTFVQVGKWQDDSIMDLRRAASGNVTFKGMLPDDQLIDLYMRSSVYVQASLHEGFGMSVAEAMLAGCIPVVTRYGSLPEVVGDTGIYARTNNPRDIAEAVREALTMSGGDRLRARERVLTMFPLEKRQRTLHDIVERHSEVRSLDTVKEQV
jgi:glycosyltransferase involved in cell wall biosynthesis